MADQTTPQTTNPTPANDNIVIDLNLDQSQISQENTPEITLDFSDFAIPQETPTIATETKIQEPTIEIQNPESTINSEPTTTQETQAIIDISSNPSEETKDQGITLDLSTPQDTTTQIPAEQASSDIFSISTQEETKPEITLDLSTPQEASTEQSQTGSDNKSPAEEIKELEIPVQETPTQTSTEQASSDIFSISTQEETKPEITLDLSTPQDSTTQPSAEQASSDIFSISTQEETKPEITLDLSTPQEAPVETPTEQPQASSDNRLDAEDKLVEETLQTTPTQETPTQTAETATPEVKVDITDLFVPTEDIIKNETPQATNITSTVSQVQPIIEETPTNTQQNTDQTPTIQPQNTQTPQPTIAEIINAPLEETPQTPEVKLPTDTLKKDEQIISQIQAMAQSGTPSIPQETQATAQTTTGINLDDILGAPTTPAAPQNNETPTITTNPITNQPLPAQTILPAFTPTTNYTLPTTNLQQVQQSIPMPGKNKKLLINLVLGVSVFLIFGFIFKTMYPIQYQQLMGGASNQATQDSIFANQPEGSDTTSNTSTEAIKPATEDNSMFANTTGINQTHGSALQETTGFDAFEDIGQVIDTGINQEATKLKLEEYISQGKKHLVLAQKTKDANTKKYSLFLWKKATSLLQDIENGKEITTDEINQQMTQFEEYLNKLTTNGETTQPEETTTQKIPTPEEFFGTGGSQQTQTPQNSTPEPTTGENTTEQFPAFN